MIKLRSLIHSSLITLTLLSASVGAVEKEYMLKAGFLYNFARFGHWDYHLESLNEFIIYNKLITLDEVTTSACNMLFITSDTFIEWQNITPLELKNVMLIGETDTFIENGGHIRFFLSSGKIRFEIAPKQLKDAGITMSSKVLRLARVVDR